MHGSSNRDEFGEGFAGADASALVGRGEVGPAALKAIAAAIARRFPR